ncbi:MAG: response regulator containing a CheY-like receiver domain and an DNA-binding domain [Pseudonocardia sp.]|jgi:DNA-binding NarL/FixJ family response regulator|nr:response regulator containing a CheY-like receiver domain and an DNA-binding domain [Pseudonocardia sp.]
MIRLMVVDDHAIVRRGLVRVVETAPDIELVGTAADGIEALHLVTRTRPDVVLMDIGMPVLDGVGATRLIVDHDPRVQVVVLTGSADDRVSEALDAGACEVVLKDAEVDVLLEAIRRAAGGGFAYPRPPAAPRDGLSPREREVLRLLAVGRSNREIARTLGITERTVKAHLHRVFRVLGATDRVQAALRGREHLARAGS